MREAPLNKIPLFVHLSDQEQETVTKYLKLKRYPSNEAIFSLGRDSDTLYIIQSGWVSLFNEAQTTLANLGPGSLVGEVDFFQKLPYSTTAQTTSEVEVWELSNPSLESLLQAHPEIGFRLSLALDAPIIQHAPNLTQRLAEAPALQALSTQQRSLLAQRMIARTFNEGDAVYRSGDPVVGMFLIEYGLIRLIGDTGNDYTELELGEIFGEMAVLTGRRHVNTTLAAQTSMVWQLAAADFEAITRADPEIRTALSRTLTGRLSYYDQADAAEIMQSIPLFADLAQEARAAIAERLILRHIPGGHIVFSQGDPGDALYIVESGQINIVNEYGQLEQRADEGQFFGEMALLTGKSRTYTATATSNTNLWALYRPDFDDMLAEYPQISIALSRMLKESLSAASSNLAEKHLQKLALMGGLTGVQLDEISSRLRQRHFKAGETIYQEGQPGQNLYFIESGQVQRYISTPTGYAPLPILESGDFCGEDALLTNRAHSVTVQAKSDVHAWILGRDDFNELIFQYPNLSAVLNRVMSDRLAETMELLRTAPAQAAVPPHAGSYAGATPGSTGSTPPQTPPIPLRPVNPPPKPPQSRPVRPIPPRAGTSRPVTSPHQRYAQSAGYARPYSQPQPNRQRRSASQVRRQAQQRSRGVQRSAPARRSRSNLGRATVIFGARMQDRLDVISGWFAATPAGTRIGLFVLTLLLVWICGIVVPFSIIEALAATFNLGEGDTETVQGPPSNRLANRLPGGSLVGWLPFVETITPTPTPTGSPTGTATASATVTETLIPTFTLTPSPTPTPQDTATPTPTATNTPRPTNTRVLARVSRQPTETPTPEPTPTPNVDFRLVKVRKLTPCENESKHHIFVHVIDANGNGLNNIPVKIAWGTNTNDSVTVKTEVKEKGDGHIDYAMFKGTYSVSVLAGSSQVASGITPDYQKDEPCPTSGNAVANSLYHASFEVVFQRRD